MKQRAFTLIELLVVIAIIGLISSLVLVNIDLPSQKQKARIAKMLEFSSSIQNVLGAEAVGIWEFNEGSGSVATDRSGYGNNGTISGGAVFTTDTPQKVVGQTQGQGKYALSFDAVNDIVSVGNGASLQDLPNVTVEAWAKPTTASGYPDVVGKISYANGGWILRTSQGGNGRLTPHVYTNTWYTCSGSVIPLNVWTHIVIRYDGINLKGYVNGVEDCTVTPAVAGNLASNATAIYIGGTDLFFGLIDDVRIYKQALTIGQIKQHYAEGLARHQYVKK